MRWLVIFTFLLSPSLAFGQAKKDPNAPTNFPPDATQLAEMKQKIEILRTKFSEVNPLRSDLRADVEVYLKAAEWLVRLNEFPTKDTAKQTHAVLDAGIARADAAKAYKSTWREVRGKPVIRGFYSTVDGSVQPYAITLPLKNDRKRLDVVLHGRDATLTEVKFIASHENAKAQPDVHDGAVIVEPYGRGNNAYRWAGETDVMEVIHEGQKHIETTEKRNIVLRGFSMGGAGTWHIGLHHPDLFAVIGPGAGFTTTRGYNKALPNPAPDYVEKCLHIYDAVDYAENAFNLPIVAYSGANDPQKAAADNIVSALKDFKEPYTFTHIVAPGLEHKQPPEWMAKCEAEFRQHIGRPMAGRYRFVTYTTAFGGASYFAILGLDEHYKKAILDINFEGTEMKVTAENISMFRILKGYTTLTIDGQKIAGKEHRIAFKDNGKWSLIADAAIFEKHKHRKTEFLQGPIDDAFKDTFIVSAPTASDTPVAKSTTVALQRFEQEWLRFFRSELPTKTQESRSNLVLFGTPKSNEKIAAELSRLPITWTEKELIVNGVSYDAATHYPVLIYPKADNNGYIVLNSGHTFHEADLKGTNANLYPRLGDWAIMKISPTDKDPAATETVSSGIFNEFWQFK